MRTSNRLAIASLALLSLVCSFIPTCPSSADPSANLVKPLTDPRWRFQLLGSAKARITHVGGAAIVTTLVPDGTDYHITLEYTGAALDQAQDYTLRFRAKADSARQMPIYAVVAAGDYPGIGLNQAAVLGTEWRSFEYTFRAGNRSGQKLFCPQFLLGGAPGKVSLSNVSLVQAAPGTALSPTKLIPSWFLQSFDPAQASLRHEGTAQVISVTATDGESWHVQLRQLNASVKDGVTYTVKFRAKADVFRDMMLMGSVSDTDYHPICDQQYVGLSLSWQEYSFQVTPHDSAGHPVGFPEFLLAKSKGTVWIDQVSVTSAEDAPAASVSLVVVSSTLIPLPYVGEIRVEGTISASDFSAKGFTLLTRRVMQADGQIITLPQPRPKHIRLTAQTTYQGFTTDSFSSVKPGDRISVIGDDAGVGKELPARLVFK